MTDITRRQAIVALLEKRKWRITFAESCTGGMAASALVDVPSASGVFDGSFVTYANRAKVELLGVSDAHIAAFGVVSEQVAGEMALGAAKAMNAQVGVGISGIAGPSGGTPEKPVGMVCFGFAVDGKVFTETRQFGNLGRDRVRECSVEFVYDTLYRVLTEGE